MPGINIGIVEDEMVIARTIESSLDDLGYDHCGPATTYGEALELLEADRPDLLLIDIHLGGRKDGIDVAEKINLLYKIPFIFLTANSDLTTIERAKKVKPHAYIVKPFSKEELFAAIEIAMSNFNDKSNYTRSKEVSSVTVNDFVFLKDGKHFHKVRFNDISYIESDNNYTCVYVNTRQKLVIRSPFTEFLESLPPTLFARVQRSYAVNITKIDSLDPEDVSVAGAKIPVSKSYRESLMKMLGISD